MVKRIHTHTSSTEAIARSHTINTPEKTHGSFSAACTVLAVTLPLVCYTSIAVEQRQFNEWAIDRPVENLSVLRISAFVTIRRISTLENRLLLKRENTSFFQQRLIRNRRKYLREGSIPTISTTPSISRPCLSCAFSAPRVRRSPYSRPVFVLRWARLR